MRTLPLLLISMVLLSACLTPKALQEGEHARSLGMAYLSEGNTPQAVTELRKAVKKNKWDSEAWQGLGLALFAAEQYGDAETAFRTAVEINPDFSQAKMNLGTLFLETGRWDEAIARFTEVLDDPEYRQPSRARHNLGWAWFNKGDYPEARESYTLVLRQFPQFCPSLRDLGGVDEAEGKLTDALARYQQAVDCDPRDLRSLMALGIIETRLDLVHAACLHLDMVKAADPFGELRDEAVEYLEMLDCGGASTNG
jgi:type IV pilus assembly protein PilF